MSVQGVLSVVADCEENGVAREVAEMFSISL